MVDVSLMSGSLSFGGRMMSRGSVGGSEFLVRELLLPLSWDQAGRMVVWWRP